MTEKQGQEQERKSFAERMVDTGEKMEAVGKGTSSAGCGVTLFVICVIILAALALAWWAFAC